MGANRATANAPARSWLSLESSSLQPVAGGAHPGSEGAMRAGSSARTLRARAESPVRWISAATPRSRHSPKRIALLSPSAAAWWRGVPACRNVACSGSRDIERGMGHQLPEAGVPPPQLLDGIVRVKVPADKILPFLAKTWLFKAAPK